MERRVDVESLEERKARLDEYKEHLSKIEAHADILRKHGINPDTLLKLLSRAINVLEHQLNIAGKNNGTNL